MPTNIEIKARAREPERQRQLAAALAEGPETVIRQWDTFFIVPAGRLKLREFAPDCGELIHYARPDGAGPKRSDYTVVPTETPAALRKALGDGGGVLGEVRKTRRLYLTGQTRIHFDDVEGLGDFIELEVVLRDDQTPEEGERIARDLMAALGIRRENLVEGAYVDLLLADGG